MSYCKKCSLSIPEDLSTCPLCGESQIEDYRSDKGSIWLGILGCCIPIVGLILYLVWKGSKPKNARAVGIGALFGLISSVVWYLFILVIAFSYTTIMR